MLTTSRLALAAIILLGTSGCASAPTAIVPSPWAVVGWHSFELRSAAASTELATRIEAERYRGLVSVGSSAAAATVASR
jgi:hypothetical protein